MKRVAVSPEDLKATLDLVARIASRPELLAHYRDVYDYGFTPASTSAFDGAKSKGVDSDDPMLLTHMNKTKAKARSAAADASHQADQAQKALGAFLDALRNALGGPDERSPREREKAREIRDPHALIHPDELRQAQEAQQRRDAADKGFGES